MVFEKLKHLFGGDHSSPVHPVQDDVSGFSPLAKAPATAAERFVKLILVADLAASVFREVSGVGDEALIQRKQVLDHLVALGLGPDDLESVERELCVGIYQGQSNPEHIVNAMSRIECARVLAWALGLEDALLGSDGAAELAELKQHVPTSPEAYSAFRARATMKPMAELLSGRSEATNVFVPLEIERPSPRRSCAEERLRAFRWLTEPALSELCTIEIGQG